MESVPGAIATGLVSYVLTPSLSFRVLTSKYNGTHIRFQLSAIDLSCFGCGERVNPISDSFRLALLFRTAK